MSDQHSAILILTPPKRLGRINFSLSHRSLRSAAHSTRGLYLWCIEGCSALGFLFRKTSSLASISRDGRLHRWLFDSLNRVWTLRCQHRIVKSYTFSYLSLLFGLNLGASNCLDRRDIGVNSLRQFGFLDFEDRSAVWGKFIWKVVDVTYNSVFVHWRIVVPAHQTYLHRVRVRSCALLQVVVVD